MNRRDIIVGVVVLILIVGAFSWIKRSKTSNVYVGNPVVEEKIEKSFNLSIPDDLDRAELKDVSGGNGSGIATRKYEGGKFTHMILADLPDSLGGTFYEGWLVRGKMGDANFAYISTGKLLMAKGGYLLEFVSASDYSDYKMVVVTLEKVNDKTPETHVLEGSF